MLLNSGEFYANDLGTGNLELVARFFDKYPSYADKVFLSVKVGIPRLSDVVWTFISRARIAGWPERSGTRCIAGEPYP